ncbi:hypothetical protein PGT21_015698 [Puccinia graminis f. sp. tritici]|uniref:Uncharacterized protein n=1 Tax=Puccinia graminis f. sp. tritici TaxID=56615 RepID=A0A5B0NWJ2_PUCGR|nr:hypothetical protein PGT21_015698 [Puccinia graminis f. sp. tritici]KAA1093525.1 hypothetical protein PGTUg99_025090 [Puccinia graminis f. sp. tritici]
MAIPVYSGTQPTLSIPAIEITQPQDLESRSEQPPLQGLKIRIRKSKPSSPTASPNGSVVPALPSSAPPGPPLSSLSPTSATPASSAPPIVPAKLGGSQLHTASAPTSKRSKKPTAAKGIKPPAQQATSSQEEFIPAPLTDADWDRMVAFSAARWKKIEEEVTLPGHQLKVISPVPLQEEGSRPAPEQPL